jgi:hypothetical protein
MNRVWLDGVQFHINQNVCRWGRGTLEVGGESDTRGAGDALSLCVFVFSLCVFFCFSVCKVVIGVREINTCVTGDGTSWDGWNRSGDWGGGNKGLRKDFPY